MTADLTDQLRLHKEAIIELLKRERDPSLTKVSISKVSRDIEIPLSFSQESSLVFRTTQSRHVGLQYSIEAADCRQN